MKLTVALMARVLMIIEMAATTKNMDAIKKPLTKSLLKTKGFFNVILL